MIEHFGSLKEIEEVFDNLEYRKTHPQMPMDSKKKTAILMI